MPKSLPSKSTVFIVLLAVLASIFFGLASLILIQLIGHRYVYLVTLPVAMLLGLVFLFDRYLFFVLVVLSRSSLDLVFNAVKIGNFGLGALLNALVILIAVLTIFEQSSTTSSKLNSLKTSWLVFLSIAFVSLTYTPTVLPATKFFLGLVSYYAMFTLGLFLVNSQDDFIKWLKIVVFSSFIPSLYSILSMLFGLGGMYISVGEGVRLASTFGHPNTYAPYIVLIVTISFYLLKIKSDLVSKNFRKVLIVNIFMLLGLLLMTKTRSTWAACFVFFALYALLYDKKFLWLVFIAPFVALLIPEVRDRLMDLNKGSSYDSTGYGTLNSYAWRKQVWHDTLAFMSPIHYFFGYGLTSFQHFSTSIIKANAYQLQKIQINAHSVYVQLIFELGAAGLLAFLNLILSHVRVLFSLYKENKLLVFVVIGLIVEFLFMSYSDNMLDYLIYEWYLWFLVGISIAVIVKGKSKNDGIKNLSNS